MNRNNPNHLTPREDQVGRNVVDSDPIKRYMAAMERARQLPTFVVVEPVQYTVDTVVRQASELGERAAARREADEQAFQDILERQDQARQG